MATLTVSNQVINKVFSRISELELNIDLPHRVGCTNREEVLSELIKLDEQIDHLFNRKAIVKIK